eukprot:2524644-Pyramimonas_sp.AAC.1
MTKRPTVTCIWPCRARQTAGAWAKPGRAAMSINPSGTELLQGSWGHYESFSRERGPGAPPQIQDLGQCRALVPLRPPCGMWRGSSRPQVGSVMQ